MPPRKKEISFESRLKRLEEIVSLMENGGLSLEESLKYFEEGAAIEKELEALLSQTRRRLTQLMSVDGQQVEIPLEDGN